MGEHPDPDIRIRREASGTPVVLADGREWLLGDGGLLNILDDVRDRMFDDIQLRDGIGKGDIGWAAWKLLEMNYELSADEGKALIFGADLDALAKGVIEAMFGPTPTRRTYTAWASASLAINGMDPAAYPTPLLRHALDLLVATGRTVPASEFCEAVAKAAGLDALRAVASKAPSGGSQLSA